MKRLYFSICLGLAPVFGLTPVCGAETPASPEHKHAEGETCTAEHAPAEHKHADGETCTAEHAPAEHKHADGETCTAEHAPAEHKHADGETCTAEHAPAEHKHADGETCPEEAAAAEHQHAEGEPCTENHDLADLIPVKVDEKARHSLDMSFEQVGSVEHSAEKTIHGQMIIPPHAVTTYALPSSGRVTFHVKSAQHVRKGDLLYTLASPEIVDMAGNTIQAKAALNRFVAELATLRNRQEQLLNIGTQNSELNTSIRFKEAEEESLKAALAASESKLKLATSGGSLKDDILYIHAAADGAVQSVDMTQGAWGEQGAPALVMTNKGDLEFASTIYGADPTEYAKAQLALTKGKNTELLNGTLRVAQQVDPTTQSRAIYFTPDRLPEGTHAGQLARLDLFTHAKDLDGFIPVPNSALVKVGVNDVVFIKTAEDSFMLKKVQTRPARQGKTPVKGLTPGQTIVTKGGYELKYILPVEGAASGKKAAGHFHSDGKFHEGEH